ncbi:30S ribosomal protein S9 [Limnoglobus roseus]|uniref:30S ribosomal protein S9 n=1 Tax=Limnoglobus roseus TaxID=2598579 RepID=A0A5C1AKA8_9BACT|nr:30S ribosomal protein S9 [Limnoglobus roseus]
MATKEAKTFYLGTGRRKTAVARVRVSEGKGAITINGRALEHYFTEDKDRAAVSGPLTATDLGNRLDVTVKAHGGGITGQADAVRQGIARAIKVMFGPATERKSVTVGNVTAVRAWKKETKGETSAPKPPTPKLAPVAAAIKPAIPAGPRPAMLPKPVVDPNAPVAPPEDPAIGIVRKLRDGKFLTRDSRMKERKKYGLRGARRGTQFSKR